MKNMKKYIVAIALMGFASAAFAQESNSDEVSSTSKTIVYPSAGTISIGVDAIPYIEFMGNMFNGTEDNSLNVGSSIIQGKYFLSEKAAIRAGLYIGSQSSTQRVYVLDQSQVPLDASIQIEDMRSTKQTGFGFGAGYQQYMGNGRLRGYYGGSFAYSLFRTSYEYQWGNEMNIDNTSPASAYWVTSNGGSTSERNLTYDNGQSHSLRLGAFVGAEYFLNSVISISGEVGLYGNYSWNTQSDRSYETVILGERQEMDEALSPKSSSFSLNTQEYIGVPMTAGRLYFNFYF